MGPSGWLEWSVGQEWGHRWHFEVAGAWSVIQERMVARLVLVGKTLEGGRACGRSWAGRSAG